METYVEEVKETTAPTNDEQNKDPCTAVKIIGRGGVEDEDEGPLIIRFRYRYLPVPVPVQQ